jgi:tRNA 2-thiouridine synthesizing protein E
MSSPDSRCTLAEPARDADGFLINPADWSEEIAVQLAGEAGIELTPAHWEILYLLQDFYARHDITPAMRALVNLVKRELGSEKGRSVYLLTLFPGSPAKLASKIAGLPKPDHCL